MGKSGEGVVQSTAPTVKDDSFQLYDLKVEVVVSKSPTEVESARLLCGAQIGDYFTLQGEMLYLPPGQGISIYSIGASIDINIPQLYLWVANIQDCLNHPSRGFGPR